jgi:hypothetical protein
MANVNSRRRFGWVAFLLCGILMKMVAMTPIGPGWLLEVLDANTELWGFNK